MNLIELTGSIFMEKIGGKGDVNNIVSALSGLLAGGDGNADFMGLVAKFQSGGIASLISTGARNSKNGTISNEQITELFGSGKIAEFASSAGLDITTAVDGLSGTIPDLINQISGSESLMAEIAGIGGISGTAKKLF